FVGACFLAWRACWRLRRDGPTVRDPEMRQLVPYVGGSCAAYLGGMMSLTLTYLVPTVMFLAIGEAVQRLAKTDPELPEERFDLRLLGRRFAAGIAVLAGTW